jgi:hypothetical protein
MPTVPVARIRQEHYKAFLALPTKNIPDTFEEWRNNQAAEEIHYLRNGWTIKPVEINSEELAIFCRDKGLPIDSHSIKTLVEEKSRRQDETQSKLTSTDPQKRPQKIVESPEC